MTDNYMTLDEVCKVYDMSRPTAAKVIKESGATYKWGNRYRVNIEEFERYLRSTKVRKEE